MKNTTTGLTVVSMSSAMLKFWLVSTELLPVAVYIHALQICIGKPTESNLHRLRAGSIQALGVLQWGCCLSDHPYGPAKLQPDVILGSDITYDSAQFLPLLQTIAAYTVVNPDVQVALLLFLSSFSTCLHHMPDHKSKGSFACLLLCTSSTACFLLCTSSIAAAAMAWHCICCMNSGIWSPKALCYMCAQGIMTLSKRMCIDSSC